MKTTYTLECDGKPVMLFRAEDEAGAKAVATCCAGHGKHVEGNVTFRQATIAEQAAWRNHSVEICDWRPDNDVLLLNPLPHDDDSK
jgi:hypothetical protein